MTRQGSAAEGNVLFHEQEDPLSPANTPGHNLPDGEKCQLNTSSKVMNPDNLPACTDFQPLEILCKITSISLLDDALEQGLAGQYLPFHASLPGPCAAGEAPALTLAGPVMPPSASGHRPPCNLNLQASCPVHLIQR